MIARTISAALLGAGIALSAAGPAAAQTPAAGTTPMFTAAQLARACGPAADDANALAARSTCHGVLVAIGQMHAMYSTGRRDARPVFCLPDPSPTLDQVSAAYISWVASNQQFANVRAAEGVLRFAAATYPCPQAAGRRR